MGWLLNFHRQKNVKPVSDKQYLEECEACHFAYAPDLTDVEAEQVGRDPFLIAYALSDSAQRTVVTLEARKPTRVRANRHVPDVCDALGIQCVDTFNMLFTLDFRI